MLVVGCESKLNVKATRPLPPDDIKEWKDKFMKHFRDKGTNDKDWTQLKTYDTYIMNSMNSLFGYKYTIKTGPYSFIETSLFNKTRRRSNNKQVWVYSVNEKYYLQMITLLRYSNPYLHKFDSFNFGLNSCDITNTVIPDFDNTDD